MSDNCEQCEKYHASAVFWERTARVAQLNSDYYQKSLTEAHRLIGSLIQQMACADTTHDAVNVTRPFPVGIRPATWVPVTAEEVLAEQAKKEAGKS